MFFTQLCAYSPEFAGTRKGMVIIMKIGEILSCNDEIVLNQDKHTVTLNVTNMGDRPIQIGSHYHFFEANKYLKFDREASYGFRLDIPSGTSVRFEPGEDKEVQLVALGGKRRVFGLNDLTCGQVSTATVFSAMDNASKRGFLQEDGN